jgi:hypothetical protein
VHHARRFTALLFLCLLRKWRLSLKQRVVILLSAVAGSIGLSACGAVKLDADQTYCLVAGNDPENPTYSECDDIGAVMMARANGNIDRLKSGPDVGFSKIGSISGSEIAMDSG